MRTTSAKPSPKNGPEPSFRTIPRARSNILSTLTSTLNDISSNAVSASSSSSDAWQHATRRRSRIISPSSSSPQPCYGSAKCPQDLKRDDFSSNRHLALAYCWSMIFSENRCPLFGIMVQRRSHPRTCGPERRLNSVCDKLVTRLRGMVIARLLRRIRGIYIEQPRPAGLSASEGCRRGCTECREDVGDHRAVRRGDRGEGLVEQHGQACLHGIGVVQ